MGYGIVNNIAVKESNCEYLIFMNADVILTDNCLEYMLKHFEDDKVSAVQPLLVYPQNLTVQSTGHVFCKFYNTHLFENRQYDAPIVQSPGIRKAVTTALCAIRKKTFDAFNGFNEYFFNAWEGMELGLKITQSGQKCLYEPKALAYHIRGGGRGQYQIDETPQTAYFWTTWGNEIKENLSFYLNDQLKEMTLDSNFTLLNFSCIRNYSEITKQLRIQIEDSLEYTELAGYSKIEFFKTLPHSLVNLANSIVYLTNNFTVVSNNKLWFKLRANNNDIIMDLSGNCFKCKELLP